MLVIPVGGCGEFGKNMTAYVARGVLLLADCGIQMPDDLMPGLEHAPDFDAVVSRYGEPTALFLTHGHEGPHRRAVGYLLRHVGRAVPSMAAADAAPVRAAHGQAGHPLAAARSAVVRRQ